MPETITTFPVAVANTKARATDFNEAHAHRRGTMIPINEDTATASDNTHNLGSDEHRWLGAYVSKVDLETGTTTATLVFQGQSTNTGSGFTAGAFEWLIEGTTVGMMDTGGFHGSFIKTGTMTTTSFSGTNVLPVMNAQTFTSSNTWTRPTTTVSVVFIQGFGGGGSGGGGGGGDGAAGGGGGGGGGGGAQGFLVARTVSGNLTITVGGGGGGAVGGASTNDGEPGNDGGDSGDGLYTFPGGKGAGAGLTAGTAGSGGSGAVTRGVFPIAGGAGSAGGGGATASNGSGSLTNSGGGGAVGVAGGGGGGGGGGAGGAGAGSGGGSGGNASNGNAGSAPNVNSGAGSGGGGGGDGANSGGSTAAGAGGQVVVYWID